MAILSPEQRKRHKKALIIGAAFGGMLSVAISLLMDFMVSDALQGTWRDAIVNDMARFFDLSVSPDSLIAYLLFALVLLVMAAIGAAIGAIFSYIVFRFLELLSS